MFKTWWQVTRPWYLRNSPTNPLTSPLHRHSMPVGIQRLTVDLSGSGVVVGHPHRMMLLCCG